MLIEVNQYCSSILVVLPNCNYFGHIETTMRCHMKYPWIDWIAGDDIMKLFLALFTINKMKKIFYLALLFLLAFAQLAIAQHLKKDGTPDRRYKENKTYSAPSNSSSATHIKKDGTPDRRYKENRTYFSTPVTSSSPSYKYYTSTRKNKTIYYYSAKRDANGKIHRSQSARHAFMRMTGYPHGRPGYVIDHVIALKRGGCDCPSNMQWQTIQDAKEKDKVE